MHWKSYGPKEKNAVQFIPDLGVGGGFHPYGFFRTTNSYTFYLDDRVTWKTKRDMISSTQEFIRLTSEIQSNSWAGTVPPGGYPDRADSRIKMYVDYVRYYAPK